MIMKFDTSLFEKNDKHFRLLNSEIGNDRSSKPQ